MFWMKYPEIRQLIGLVISEPKQMLVSDQICLKRRRGLDAEEAVQCGADRCAEAGRSGCTGCRSESKGWDQRETFYRWKAKYAGLEVDQVRQMAQLQEENP